MIEDLANFGWLDFYPGRSGIGFVVSVPGVMGGRGVSVLWPIRGMAIRKGDGFGDDDPACFVALEYFDIGGVLGVDRNEGAGSASLGRGVDDELVGRQRGQGAANRFEVVAAAYAGADAVGDLGQAYRIVRDSLIAAEQLKDSDEYSVASATEFQL
ncbi:hypothetical protein [Mycolicibacterium peregrinum]|uniref:hypothetical protein n=1 Tax=Mycolicibacterium peregrinum TaxID=43304 RepID=UPI003AB00195